tara:strand:+ start:642 stop:2699 length:2058 start_codon:yes stop_codon:yes gene_type:complete
MFQTPQQRAGSGIMAGVAPVQGYENGGSVPEYTPKFLREEEDLLDQVKGQFEKTPEGSGMNLRDLTDFFIVDPEDEYDVAMAAATAGLMAFPPAAAATALARMGYKGKKLYDKVSKLKQLQDKIAKPSERAGLTKTVTKPIGSVMAARELEDAVEDPTQFVEDYYEIGQDAAEIGELLYDNREDLTRLGLEELKDSEALQQENMIGPFSDFRGMADGGIASIPVYMDDGGEAKKTKKKSKKGLGIKALKDKLKDLVNKGKIEIEDAEEVLGTTTKTKPRVRVDASGQVVDFDKPTITRRQEAAARRKANAETKPPPEPKPPESTTKPKDADKPKDDQEKQATETSTATSDKDVSASQQAADDIVFDNKKRGNIITRNPLISLLGGVGLAPGVAGVVDKYAGTEIGPIVREGYKSGLETLGEGVSAFTSGYTGEPGEEPTPPTMPQNSGINYSDLTRPPAPPASAQPNVAAVAGTQTQPNVQAQEEEQERRKVLPGFRPFGGKIARALLGEDEAFGGDRGAIDFIRSEDSEGRSFMDNVMNTLSDPRMRYQLSQAAKATEGFVPRNFATDMEEAGQAYDDMIAKRDYLEAQTRDVDKTDTEKLVDYYVDSVAAKNPDLTEDQLASLRTGMNMSLFKSSRDAAELAAKLEILSLVPNAAITSEMYERLAQGSIDQNLLDMISGDVTQ